MKSSMLYIVSLITATFSFLFLLFSDLLQIKKYRFSATLFTIFGYLGILSSIIFLIVLFKAPKSNTLLFSLCMWCLAGIFFCTLVYTVFFAVRIGKEPEKRKEERRVIMHGLYGLVRHPGFYWFTLLLVVLNLIYRRPLFILASAYMILLDLLLILIEDTLLFPKLFVDYDIYKEKVPFIIPAPGKNHEGQ